MCCILPPRGRRPSISWPDLRVMMVTAYGDEERRRQAQEAGALQFLTKPVDFDLLKEELRRLAGGSA